jgi:hypothetical protein
MTINAKDFLEIQNLVSSYTLTTDNKDVDGFMDCWVSPEEFEGYDSGSFGHMKTWQELRDFEAHHVGEGGMANGKRHQVTNLHIKLVSETEALVTHDMLVLEVDNEPAIIATGRYNDSKVVKTANGWKFSYRHLHVDAGFFKLLEKWKAAGLVGDGAH